MKEYKTVLINTDYKNHLDEQLNVFAKKGWYIKELITKSITKNGYGEFIYLLERDDHMVRISGETTETVNGQILHDKIEEIIINQSQVIHRDPDMIKENEQYPQTRFKNLKPTPPPPPPGRTIREGDQP